MSLTLRLTICFVQLLLLANAMEEDDLIELFISIRLPFSVKKDEVINVPVWVRNPLQYKLNVVITLKNENSEYEIIDFDNKVISVKTLTKSVTLEDHSSSRIYFLIRPKVIGNVTLTFEASTSNDFEIIHKTIRDDLIELFISIRLPFSVKKEEVINVPVWVRNPLQYKLNVVITLKNENSEYEIIDFDNKVISVKTLTKSVTLEDHSSSRIYFLIRPKVIGNVTLTFEASTSNDFEIIHKTMYVVSEGITQYDTNVLLINLKRIPEQKTTFELELPKDLVVPDSQHVEVGVVGDIIGLVLKNLDNLVNLPTGPVEQTMSSLLPNYFIIKYLKISKRLTPIVEARLRRNLETGYQNILICRHKDGSFSNLEARNGSTWLTSYVLRFLPQFEEFINVNETIIEEGLAYLSKQQVQNGMFTENGEYLYPSQRNSISLTGAAILAFLENPAYAEKFLPNITKGLEFIAKSHEKYKWLHIHSLATYASKKIKHLSSEEQSLIKWLSESSLDNQSKWWQYVFLSDVEITSFNLLKLLDSYSTKIDNIVPTVKRLIAQRKRLGGFASTQDTVDGLISLIKYAEFSDYEPAKMDVNITAKDKDKNMKLTEDNRILYKSVKLDPETKSINIAAEGNGSALLEIYSQYNTFKDHKSLYPSFTIKTFKPNRLSYLSMLVCVTYVGRGVSSNMALLEINTPSGYVIDIENFKKIQKLKGVSHTELKDSGSLLVVYFQPLYKNVETCLTVDALKIYAVALQKPSLIVMYDYYNEDKRAVAFYDVESKLCDICFTLEDCNKCE